MSRFDYDIVIIGGGSGGLMAAKVAKGLGKKVAIVEKDKLGGECTWSGCVPSKTIIKAASIAHAIKNREVFGLHDSCAGIDTSAVMTHVRKVIENVYTSHTPQELAKHDIEVLFAQPHFLDEHTLALDDKTITAGKFIIATGSRPFVPPIEGLDTVEFLTNETLFQLNELPRSLIILGGGAIGCEMASALNRLGVEVTVIEMQESILVHDDRELVKILSRHMKQEGVTIKTSMKAESVASSPEGVTVACIDRDGKHHTFNAQRLLVAVGRRPNIKKLALDKVSVATKPKGIVVDRTLRTSRANIYACGDVVGPYQFSHMAGAQAIVAARNACLPIKKKIDYNHVLWVTFTAPELAAAGMTEKQARAAHGDKIDVYRYEYANLDRAKIDDAMVGMGKFICDKKGRLLGAHIVGARAGELIHEVQLGKAKGIRFTDFNSVVHAYPTYSELIWHGSKIAYIDRLRSNPFIKVLSWLFKGKKRKGE